MLCISCADDYQQLAVFVSVLLVFAVIGASLLHKSDWANFAGVLLWMSHHLLHYCRAHMAVSSKVSVTLPSVTCNPTSMMLAAWCPLQQLTSFWLQDSVPMLLLTTLLNKKEGVYLASHTTFIHSALLSGCNTKSGQ